MPDIYSELTKGLYKIKPVQGNVFEIDPEQLGPGSMLSTILQNVGNLQNGKNDFDNTKSGYILGVEDGVAKFFIGNSNNYLNWDGLSLLIIGILTAGTFQTATAGTRRIRITGTLQTDTTPNQVANSLALITATDTLVFTLGDLSTSLLFMDLTTLPDKTNSGIFVESNLPGTGNGVLIGASIINQTNDGQAGYFGTNGTGQSLVVYNNGSGIPFSIAQVTITSTNFRKYITLDNGSTPGDGMTIWKSNGITPNGNLSGTVGDVCFNADGGKSYFCTGTTNWTVMGSSDSKYTTTTTVSWLNGRTQYIQLANGNNNITLNNPVDGGRYMLIVKQPSSGAAGTVTWPTISWVGGAIPVLTPTNSKVDIMTFVYDATNGVYYGNNSFNY